MKEYEQFKPIPEPEKPEYYFIIPEFNSQGRLCNYHTDGNAEIKVPVGEWERFNKMAGRQHEIVDGVVAFNPELEPCMSDELIRTELMEIEKHLIEILDKERLDASCGVIQPAPTAFGASKKNTLIAERNRLLGKLTIS